MRYVFFVIVEFLYLLPVISKGSYLNIFWMILLAYVLFLIHKVEKGRNSNSELTRGEKLQVIVTAILMPIVAGAFYYYSWKKRLPKIASQANKYSIISFLISMGLVISILFLVGFNSYNSAKDRAIRDYQLQNQKTLPTSSPR